MGQVLIVGSYITDLTSRTRKLPEPGETVLGRTFSAGPGGKGGNQAVQAARLGASVIMVTKVGKDVFGEEALKNFEKENIDTSSVYTTEEAATGTALIAVEDSGENMIVVTPGACALLTKEEVRRAAAAFEKAEIVVVQLETSMEAVEEAALQAEAAKKPLVLNPAPYQEMPERLLKRVMYVTPNETEASAMTGIRVKDQETAAEAARFLHRKGIPHVLITLGKQGCFVSSEGEEYMIPASDVKAVDTTGAGDSFSGALAAQLSRGKTLKEASRSAVAAAGISVTRPGAAPSMPYEKEIM